MVYWLLMSFGCIIVALSIYVVQALAFRVGAFFSLLLALGPLFQSFSVNDVFEGLDDRVRDFFFQYRGERTPSSEIVIVDIDSPTLKRLGQWPFPRTVLAQVLDKIQEGQPKSIGFDIIFAEQDRLSPIAWLARFKEWGLPFNFSSAGYSGESKEGFVLDNDLYFAKRIEAANVVMGSVLMPGLEGEKSSVRAHPIFGAHEFFPYAYFGKSFLLNTPKIQSKVFQQGLFNTSPEQFGTGGRYPLFMLGPDGNHLTAYPSLGLEMLFVGEGLVRGECFRDGLALLDAQGEKRFEIPLDASGCLLLNYYGKGKNFSYISFKDVWEGTFERHFFRDKKVLIGSSDPTLGDLVSTPFGGNFPGVEIHATVMSNILNHETLSYSGSWTLPSKFLFILLVGMALSFVSARFHPFISGGFVIFIFLVSPFAAYNLFIETGLFFPFSQAFFSIAAVSLSVFAIDYAVEGKKRKWVTQHFNCLVSKGVLSELQTNPKVLQRPISCEGTIMFLDIEGFTSYAEKIPADKVVEKLNEILESASSFVIKNEGFIDKFLGDGLMAAWGVPREVNMGSVKACACALDLVKIVNKKLPPKLKFRVGIATGPLASGFLGGKDRKNYTVIGDTVNVASRLEGLGKKYGVPIIICSRTAAQVKEYFDLKKLETTKIIGREEPMEIWGISD